MEERERRGEKSRIETGTKEKAPSSSCAPNVAEAEGSDTNRDTAEDEDIHAKLDVSSDKFDPLLALYSPTVPLPFPNIKCFNNIAEYESFLKGGRGRAKPENVEKKQRKARKGIADPERIERLKKLMVHNAVPEEGEGSSARHSRRNKAPKNVLTRMPLHTGSPLGELHRCVEERIRVKVHIRTFKGLRGVCSGFIVAFDKFWNMAMVDVDETYKEPLRGEAFYHEKALTVTRLFDKLKLQESPEEGASERKHTGKGKTIALQTQPGTQKQTPTRLPPHTITDPQGEDRSRGDTRGRDGREGDTKSVHTKTDPRLAKYIVGPPEKDDPRAQGAPVKSHGSETEDQGLQKKGSQPYGRVHTRHINQLFIRGENVLLVNLQPL